VQTIEDFLTQFRRERIWTRTLFSAVPSEHEGWAPSASDFSCIGLLRHLMQAEVFYRRLLLAGARGEVFDPFGLPGDLQQRVDAFRAPNVKLSQNEKRGSTVIECLASWAAIQAETEQELAAITPEQFAGCRTRHPLSGMTARLWELALVMLAHEGHHRGQLSAYLKVLGLRQPPIFFGDTEAAVP
jgi:uncharacterized damage-inducible protein DinB